MFTKFLNVNILLFCYLILFYIENFQQAKKRSAISYWRRSMLCKILTLINFSVCSIKRATHVCKKSLYLSNYLMHLFLFHIFFLQFYIDFQAYFCSCFQIISQFIKLFYRKYFAQMLNNIDVFSFPTNFVFACNVTLLQ